MQWPIIPLKNFIIPISIDISIKTHQLYALGRLKWILDIIWPLNQPKKLEKTSLNVKFLSGINCTLLHLRKKLTLAWAKDHFSIFLSFFSLDRLCLLGKYLSMLAYACFECMIWLMSHMRVLRKRPMPTLVPLPAAPHKVARAACASASLIL